MMHMGLLVAILLVFYLYLLVRWQYVRRPGCLLIGVAGLLLAILGMFFEPWWINEGAWARVLSAVFGILGVIVAFGSAVAVCYGGKLPGVDKVDREMTEKMEHPGA